MQILKICEHCKKEFIAKKTTTKCCSDEYAKRFYKLNKRNDKVAQTEIKTVTKRQPKAFITEEQLKTIQAKNYLNLKEGVILLNVSALTLRRWTLDGKMKAHKAGKKWMFDAEQLQLCRLNRF